MSFSQEIAKFGTNTVRAIEKTRRGVIIKLFGSVIRDTPVDTGRLRANWQLTEGQPAQGTVDAVKPGKTGLDLSEAQKVNQTNGDVSVYLTNNLPYAARIEFEGWSKIKAPQGMVRRNVARFGRLIQVQVKNP